MKIIDPHQMHRHHRRAERRGEDDFRARVPADRCGIAQFREHINKGIEVELLSARLARLKMNSTPLPLGV